METITVHRKDRSAKAKPARAKLYEAHLRLFRQLWGSVESDVEARWVELLRETTGGLVRSLERAAALWRDDPRSRAQLSAAVLLVGANLPDHARLFRRQRRAISGQVTPHVVSLRSTCGSLPALMRCLVKRLVPPDFLQSLDLAGPLKASFHAIEAWFAAKGSGRPIVLILEDCDAFSPKALQDLVSVACSHAQRLPLQLVLGVASHMGVVHSLLGGVASSRLRLHLLKAPTPAEFRRRVLEPALVPSAECPVRLGHRLRTLLLDVLFRRLDLASQSFCRRLKLCLLEHVLRQTPREAADLSAALRGRPPAGLGRQLRACDRSADFARWLGGLLRCDLTPAALCPGGLAAAELFQTGLAAFLRASPAHVAQTLTAALADLPDDDEEQSELRRRLTELCAELKAAEEAPRPSVFQMESKMSLKTLQKGLKDMQARQRPGERCALELRRCLEAAASALCPDLSAFSGVVFDDLAVVRALLNPSQRADLQTALARPSVYLNAESATEEEGRMLSPRSPDLSILFKLHLECPHFINLYDWLQAFAAVLGEQLDENSAPSGTVQARFAQGVAELQFLGLIKATSRKTDHVVRLTWGTC